MAVTTTTTLSAQFQAYFFKTLLKYQINTLKLNEFALTAELEKGQGAKQVKFFRPGAADATQVQTLSEGVPISTSRNLTLTPITVNLQQFGEKVDISDILTDTEFFNAGKQASKTLGEDAAFKADSISRNVLVTSDNTGTSGAGSGITERYVQGLGSFTNLSNAATGAAFTDAQDILDAVTALEVNLAPMRDDGYVGLFPPQIYRDIMRDADFLRAAEYSSVNSLWKGEIGSLYGLRIVKHTNAFREANAAQYVDTSPATAGGVTNTTAGPIFSCLIMGDQAFAVSPIAGDSITMPRMYILDQPDKLDPLNQIKVIGYKQFYNAVLLNANFVINLRSKSRFA